MERDKLLHLLAGVITYAAGDLIGLGPAAVLLAAFGKEAYDLLTGRGTPEFADVVYTLAGGLLAYVVLGWI